MIAVRPLSSLIDKIVKITVAGLKPGQNITLQARLDGDKGEVFESHAHYIADKDNMVDVCRQPSVGGSYTGVESMGLLWSMEATPGQRKGLMLRKKDVTKPYNIVLNCFDGHLSPLERSLQPSSSVTFEKCYMADGVKRIPVKEARIRGTLFLPEGEGPFPGIIDLLGAVGGVVEFKASLLASHGFASLALAYFDYDDLPSDPPACFELEYFEEAAEWLIRHPKVLSQGIGIHSNCFGSWLALLLASYRSDLLKAVVAISPWHAAIWKPYNYRGKLSSSYSFPLQSIVATDEGNIYRYCHSSAALTEIKNPSAELPAVTPVGNISCPVLLVSGSDDAYLDSDFMVNYIIQQMKKAGKEDLCSVSRFPNAGHLIEPPYTPHCYASYFSLFNQHLVWGGETRDHALAEEVAWEQILDFFRQKLPRSN